MHDIWNPWHGCVKKSEGCQNCYMYFLDKQRHQDGSNIYRVKNNFDYPIQRDKNGLFKITSGEQIRVCMTSDFFLEEADQWRDETWKIMKQRPDVVFFLLTKRPERVKNCLPSDWGNGWENIFFNVTCENQKRADERIPIMFDLPFKHKGIMVAPFIEEVSIKKYLSQHQIEQVIAGGENYDGCRLLKYEWVKKLHEECVEYNTTFCFIETGTKFERGGKIYTTYSKRQQSVMAFETGLQFIGKEINFKLDFSNNNDLFGNDNVYKKTLRERCNNCGSRIICNGCVNCGICDNNCEECGKL